MSYLSVAKFIDTGAAADGDVEIYHYSAEAAHTNAPASYYATTYEYLSYGPVKNIDLELFANLSSLFAQADIIELCKLPNFTEKIVSKLRAMGFTDIDSVHDKTGWDVANKFGIVNNATKNIIGENPENWNALWDNVDQSAIYSSLKSDNLWKKYVTLHIIGLNLHRLASTATVDRFGDLFPSYMPNPDKHRHDKFGKWKSFPKLSAEEAYKSFVTIPQNLGGGAPLNYQGRTGGDAFWDSAPTPNTVIKESNSYPAHNVFGEGAFNNWRDETYVMGAENGRDFDSNLAIFINNIFLRAFEKSREDVALNYINLQNQEAVSWLVGKVQEIEGLSSEGDAIREIRQRNEQAAGQILDLTTDPGDLTADQRRDRDAFLKRAEQCILMAAIGKIGKIKKDERKAEIDDALGSDGSFSEGRAPFGGRVHNISVDNDLYVNYAASDGKTFEYSTSLLPEISEKINYFFQLSKINTIKTDHGLREVEMPLLFEGGSNLDGTETVKYHHTKLFVTPNTNTKEITVEKLINTQAHQANQSIALENVSIKFHGENQATAKTNVDVTITISIPNLLILQTMFENTTYYYDASGKKQEVKYQYGLIDLITYLHRSDLGDVWGDLQKNGARYYNPTYFKNYNRLAMKVVSTMPTPGKSGFQGKILEYYKKVYSHLDNTPLVLDLAHVEHTIDKQAENHGAKLKITYKGFVKSYLQDPRFDIIRTKDDNKTKIEDEISFIEELKQIDDINIAIKRIEAFNRTNQDEVLDISRQNKLVSELFGREKLYRLKVKGDSFATHVSSGDANLKSTNTIYSDCVPSRDVSKYAESTVAPALVDVISGSVESETEYSINYFYLGDLIDVALDNCYDARATTGFDIPSDGQTKFPISVVMPAFKPLIPAELRNGSQLYFFREPSSEEISLSDFPISVEYFDRWFQDEINNSKPVFYTVGTLINRVLNDIVNANLLDSCYLNGSSTRVRFALTSDFGLADVGKDIQKNKRYLGSGVDFFTEQLMSQKSPILKLKKQQAPFFKKDAKIPREDHKNYLFVHPIQSTFHSYRGLSTNFNDLEKHNIANLTRDLVTDLDGQYSQFTQALSFSKEDSNYRAEARFQTENLYTLAQLASVYNVTAKTFPALDIFPGVLVYVNAGFYQDPSILNSIPNILGIGGFHLVESVTHTANINGSDLTDFRTDIVANWVSNASIRIEGEVPTERLTYEINVAADETISVNDELVAPPPSEPLATVPAPRIVEANMEFSWNRDAEKATNGKWYYYVERWRDDIIDASFKQGEKVTALVKFKLTSGKFALGIPAPEVPQSGRERGVKIKGLLQIRYKQE